VGDTRRTKIPHDYTLDAQVFPCRRVILLDQQYIYLPSFTDISLSGGSSCIMASERITQFSMFLFFPVLLLCILMKLEDDRSKLIIEFSLIIFRQKANP
jgi:hypothetical protein